MLEHLLLGWPSFQLHGPPSLLGASCFPIHCLTAIAPKGWVEMGAARLCHDPCLHLLLPSTTSGALFTNLGFLLPLQMENHHLQVHCLHRLLSLLHPVHAHSTHCLPYSPSRSPPLPAPPCQAHQAQICVSFFPFQLDNPASAAKPSSRADSSLECILKLGRSREGPWTDIWSVTSDMTLALSLDGRLLAAEMGVRNGLKCVTLRSPVIVTNDTDVALEVCVCPMDLLDFADDEGAVEEVREEVWENQRYQPLMGWGSSWPGHLLPSDPARFSAADLTQSSKVRRRFFLVQGNG